MTLKTTLNSTLSVEIEIFMEDQLPSNKTLITLKNTTEATQATILNKDLFDMFSENLITSKANSTAEKT